MNTQDKQNILSICRRALSDIDIALDTLKKAKRWGIFDTLGGGLVSTLMKRSKMADVEAHVARIRKSLSELDHELATVQFTGFNYSTGRFAFDVYFDNIITDFRVLGEIDRAQAELENLQMKLQTLEQQISKS